MRTEPRSEITHYAPWQHGHGTSRHWTRVIAGRLYSFTAVTMPNGERRYFASRFDGSDARFDCAWTHGILSWTFKPHFQGLTVEVIARDDSGPYPVVKVRYPESPATPPEWIAADAITLR